MVEHGPTWRIKGPDLAQWGRCHCICAQTSVEICLVCYRLNWKTTTLLAIPHVNV